MKSPKGKGLLADKVAVLTVPHSQCGKDPQTYFSAASVISLHSRLSSHPVESEVKYKIVRLSYSLSSYVSASDSWVPSCLFVRPSVVVHPHGVASPLSFCDSG